MATLTVQIKDDALKEEIIQAFITLYNNPDDLAGEDLVLQQISNYILGVLNEKIRKQASDQAELAIIEKNSLL